MLYLSSFVHLCQCASVLTSHRAYYNQSLLFVSGPPATIPAIPFFTKQLLTEKKKKRKRKSTTENLRVMLYSVDKTEILSLGLSISDNSEKLLWRQKGGSQGTYGFLQQRLGSQDIKNYLLLQEHQICQAKEFSAFLCMGSHRDRAPWNYSLDGHLSYLGSCLCFLILHFLRVPCRMVAALSDDLMAGIPFPSWVPSGITVRGGCSSQ